MGLVAFDMKLYYKRGFKKNGLIPLFPILLEWLSNKIDKFSVTLEFYHRSNKLLQHEGAI